jgi:hypothetical protein
MGIAAIMALQILAFGLVLWVQASSEDRSDRKREQETADQNFVGCLRGNDIRQGNIENEKEPGQVLDLTLLPSVQASPQWFRDITIELKGLSEAAAKAPIDPNSAKGRRIARLQASIRDCGAEYPDHTPGLALVPTTTTTGATP